MSSPLDIHPGVGSLYHAIVLFKIFEELYSVVGSGCTFP